MPGAPCLNGVAAALTCLWFFTSASLVADPPGTRLLLAVGSNTLGESAVPALAEGYLATEKKATHLKTERAGDLIWVSGQLPGGEAVYIEIHATGSGDAFKSILGNYPASKESCDIGMSSRRITEEEVDQILEQRGLKMDIRGTAPGKGSEHAVALDGLTIITHPENPLTRISFRALQSIYSREAKSWKEVADWVAAGGTNAQTIVPVRRKEPSGTLDFFTRRIKPKAEGLNDPATVAFVSNEEVAAKVAATPNAIGFIGHGSLVNAGVKRIQVYNDFEDESAMSADQAVYPDAEAVQSGAYPLSRLVYFYTSPFPGNPEVVPFIQFSLSTAGQDLMANVGGLVRVEGSWHDIASGLSEGDSAPLGTRSTSGPDGRKLRVVLRVHGSNTVGANYAVLMAYNFLITYRGKGQAQAPIEDHTIEVETPEGENAIIHNLMCDIDGDGTWETVEVRPSGSGDAFRSLYRGDCDLGMSSRKITDAELRDIREWSGDLSQPSAQFALGLDALAIVTHPSNPVTRLTMDQVIQIFLGRMTNWSEAGGPDRPIRVHTRPDRSGTYQFFCKSVLGGRSVTSSARRHPENSAISEAVAQDPLAIGAVPLDSLGPARVLEIARSPAGPFFPPTAEHARACRYPEELCRYLYFYVSEQQPPTITAVRNWKVARAFAAMSQQWRGQAILASCGFIPVLNLIDREKTILQKGGESPQAYIERLLALDAAVAEKKAVLQPDFPGDEVAPRLLFESGTTLTPESRNALELQFPSLLRLYPALATHPFAAEGWTDPMPTEAENQTISDARAGEVARILKSSASLDLKTAGKGKSPFPPSDSEINKRVNRRVVLKTRF
jgi:ABC-type phosphate transport system substrate-binding protein